MVGPFTTLTAIIGPNGGGKFNRNGCKNEVYTLILTLIIILFSGKSNLLDAVAFALALPLPRGKYAHVRDLVYNNRGGNQNNDDDIGVNESQQLASEQDMYVKLNFEGALSLRRSYAVRDQVCEHSVIEGQQETPLTSDEFKIRTRDMNLSVGDFCVYQDRLLTFTKLNLNEIFERLSGSLNLKAEYDRLSEYKLMVEQQLRSVSEQLKEKKHEKVKVKGLGEY